MSTGTPYIGSKISLISKAKIRYEGFLYTIDTNESTVTLAKVRSLGTENRATEKKVAARDEIYEYIVFRGTDIDDLHVSEAPKPTSQISQDPAIVQTGSSSQPALYSQMQNQMATQFAQNYNPFGGMTPQFGYSFGFRPQTNIPVSAHPHSSNMPPMSNFNQKESQAEENLNRTPSPAPLSAAPGSRVSQREMRENRPSDRSLERNRSEKRNNEKVDNISADKKREDKNRERDKGSFREKERDREREKERDSRKVRESEREVRKEKRVSRDRDNGRDSARDRDLGRERDSGRDRDNGRDRDGRRERDSGRDYRREHPRDQGRDNDEREERRRDANRSTKDRDNDRMHKGRTRDPDSDREERPRRGSGSGGRGRRSSKQSSNRGGSSRSGPNMKAKFEEDFDFEQANAKFNKEEVEKELLTALKKNLILKDDDDDVIVEKDTVKNAVDEDKDEDEQDGLPSPANYYDPSKSFFDNISCEAMEAGAMNTHRPNLRRQERERNVETFGPPPRGYRGRGRPYRARGMRGGRGRGYNRGRGGSYRGNYGRQSGSRGWVDYDFDFKSAGIDRRS